MGGGFQLKWGVPLEMEMEMEMGMWSRHRGSVEWKSGNWRIAR